MRTAFGEPGDVRNSRASSPPRPARRCASRGAPPSSSRCRRRSSPGDRAPSGLPAIERLLPFACELLQWPVHLGRVIGVRAELTSSLHMPGAREVEPGACLNGQQRALLAYRFSAPGSACHARGRGFESRRSVSSLQKSCKPQCFVARPGEGTARLSVHPAHPARRSTQRAGRSRQSRKMYGRGDRRSSTTSDETPPPTSTFPQPWSKYIAATQAGKLILA